MKGTIGYGEVVEFVCEVHEKEWDRHLLQKLSELERENQELNTSLKNERKELQGMRELIKSMEKEMDLREETDDNYILRNLLVPWNGGGPGGTIAEYCGCRKDMLYLVQ